MAYSFNSASDYLGISKKYLENYSKIGEEFPYYKDGRLYKISEEELDTWHEKYQFASVTLIKSDYIKCLEFAINSFYNYRSTSDFGTPQQRGAGKFISDFVIGKLGELAVQKFWKDKFDIDIKLDFDIREAVVGQDIVEIARPRRGGRVFNPLRKRIAIKTSKLKNVYLVAPVKEVEDTERKSDIYIYARVDLVFNHFIRILKGHTSLTNVNNIIPDFESMQANIAGFTTIEELSINPPVEILPKMNQEIQPSYILPSGKLKSTRDDWERLIESL